MKPVLGALSAWLTGCAAAGILLSTPAAAQQTVSTTTGTFTSVASPTASGVEVFYGIRYAAPPTKQLRWAPPQAPVPPSGTVLASAPGASCPQDGFATPPAQSEDCLFLNVYIPSAAKLASKLPVLFWIHGGALVSGSGAQYDPSIMIAENDLIVVTINYRLGALGWLVEPEFAALTANTFQKIGDAGNYGLMDQQFALQWVQSNIGAFGGDPTKVTIAGQSAGGMSVLANLASTSTGRGLFRGAIIESGAYQLHQVPSQAIYQAIFGVGFEDYVGCVQGRNPTCLRQVTVANLLTAQDNVFGAAGIAPVFGTLTLPQPLDTAFSTGAFNRVPVLQGTNANEGRYIEPFYVAADGSDGQVAAAGGPASLDLTQPSTWCGTPQYYAQGTCTYGQELQILVNAFGSLTGVAAQVNTPSFQAKVAAAYPLSAFPDPYLRNNAPSADEALSQLLTDWSFACNGLDANQELAGFVPVYAYEFDDPLAPPAGGTLITAPNDVLGFPTASEHAAELPFLFNFAPGYQPALSADEQQLAAEMRRYWGNFVVSGNPNAGASHQPVPSWPSFNPGRFLHRAEPVERMLALVPGPQLPHPFGNFRQEHFCDLWEPALRAEPPL